MYFHNLTNVKKQGAVIQTTSESFLIVQRFLAWCSLSVLKCAKTSREIKSVQQEPQIKLSSFQYQNLQRKYKFEFHVNLWQWGKALCPGSCTSAGVWGAGQDLKVKVWYKNLQCCSVSCFETNSSPWTGPLDCVCAVDAIFNDIIWPIKWLLCVSAVWADMLQMSRTR